MDVDRSLVKLLETERGLLLEVYVKPRSKESRIAVESDEVVFYCAEEPVGGRVNRELVKVFSRVLGGRVELVSGFSSRQKKLVITGVEKSDVEGLLLGL